VFKTFEGRISGKQNKGVSLKAFTFFEKNSTHTSFLCVKLLVFKKSPKYTWVHVGNGIMNAVGLVSLTV